MERKKAYFITGIITVLAGLVVWLLWENAIRSYWVVVQIGAMYGFIRGAFDLGRWIAKPLSVPRIPKSNSPAQFTKRGWEV